MIRIVIVLLILLVVLSFFGISLRAIVMSPAGQDNISFVWQLLQNAWNALVSWLASLGNFSH